jgi:Protein of unknown function (DUF723)
VKKLTTSEFIENAKITHGHLYNYDDVIYNGGEIKVRIKCPKHGIFSQAPKKHISGDGCPDCGRHKTKNSRKLTTKKFVEKAKIIHNNFYNYKNVTYNYSHLPVKIDCPVHGEFQQIARNHLMGQGCPKCKIISIKEKLTHTTDDFIKKAKHVHGNRYDYNRVDYCGEENEIIITCKTHGEFLQTPHNHLAGKGCSECGLIKTLNSIKLTTVEFIKRAKNIHNNYYDYNKTIFENSEINVIITCNIHGDFEQKSHNHLNGQGCPRCKYNNSISKPALSWLLYLEQENNINIIKEYPIPNTRYSADGYCKETNTIYEFYGDYFHGNPNKNFKSTCGFDVKKAYEKTLKRETKIKDLKYNIITIWEDDYNRFIKPFISYVIKRKASLLWFEYQKK